jgi:RHS repeat-associated protein
MSSTTLLATDQQRSVLNTLRTDHPPQAIAHSPYGHRPTACGLLSLLGFNGELADPMTGHYLLGNGYRAFNPVLMRFNSPDNLSPFGKGGINPYSYCLNDPINRYDPDGHISLKTTRNIVIALNRLAKNAKITANLKPKDRIAYLVKFYEKTRDTHRDSIISTDLKLLNLLPQKSDGSLSRLQDMAAEAVISHNIPFNDMPSVPNKIKSTLNLTPPDDFREVIHSISKPHVPFEQIKSDHMYFELLERLKNSPQSHGVERAIRIYKAKLYDNAPLRARILEEVENIRRSM